MKSNSARRDWKLRVSLACLAIAALLPFSLQAQFSYLSNNATIWGYNGSGGVANIPSILNDLPPSTIGSRAFSNRSNLTSVTIPNGVTSIGGMEFRGCSNLTNVMIPDSVTSIAPRAFSGCSGLTSITVDPRNPHYSTVDGVLFNKTMTKLIQCPGGKAGPHTIRHGVTGIGDWAFEDCTNLTSVTIPNGVISIEGMAFCGCHSLTSVTIPDTVTSIGSGAFSVCRSLRSVTIPNSITNMEGSVFYGCEGLTNVTIPESVASIGTGAFAACSGLTSVAIPESVTTIGNNAFSHCSGLTSVTIPKRISNIGFQAFSGCGRLTAIAVDPLNSDYSAVDGVLFNKTMTKLIRCPGGKAGSYAVPNSVTNIENDAFSHCAGLTSVTIPNSISSITPSAFSGCTGLTVIAVSPRNSYYSTVGGVLLNKSRTKLIRCPGGKAGSYAVPNSVTSIESSAFAGCNGLTNVTIPNSVTRIGNSAFGDCNGLTSATIPSSITNIEMWTFRGCTNLREAHFQGNAPSLGGAVGAMFDKFERMGGGWGAFDRTGQAIVYYLPGTTGWSQTFGGRPTALDPRSRTRAK